MTEQQSKNNKSNNKHTRFQMLFDTDIPVSTDYIYFHLNISDYM